MLVFKSSLFVIVKNVAYALGGGAFAALIASIWLELIIAIIIGVAFALLMTYFAVFGDNFRVEVAGDIFTVYRRNKIKHQFDVTEVSLHARIKTVDGDSDCKLTVTGCDGKSAHIDLSMLGQSRFYKLLDALGVLDAEPIEVKTTTKK